MLGAKLAWEIYLSVDEAMEQIDMAGGSGSYSAGFGESLLSFDSGRRKCLAEESNAFALQYPSNFSSPYCYQCHKVWWEVPMHPVSSDPPFAFALLAGDALPLSWPVCLLAFAKAQTRNASS